VQRRLERAPAPGAARWRGNWFTAAGTIPGGRKRKSPYPNVFATRADCEYLSPVRVSSPTSRRGYTDYRSVYRVRLIRPGMVDKDCGTGVLECLYDIVAHHNPTAGFRCPQSGGGAGQFRPPRAAPPCAAWWPFPCAQALPPPSGVRRCCRSRSLRRCRCSSVSGGLRLYGWDRR
jgi:hypothetical protein